MTPRNKHEAFDEAEKILDCYVNYVVNRILTFNEAIEILLASKKVTLFFTKDEIEAVMSFELQKGQTVQ
jgi:hypothetical protein|tara:strand:+ start:70 stop:276 length:207 start_codon:yes stop_codon:yes gene_type:complete